VEDKVTLGVLDPRAKKVIIAEENGETEEDTYMYKKAQDVLRVTMDVNAGQKKANERLMKANANAPGAKEPIHLHERRAKIKVEQSTTQLEEKIDEDTLCS